MNLFISSFESYLKIQDIVNYSFFSNVFVPTTDISNYLFFLINGFLCFAIAGTNYENYHDILFRKCNKEVKN